MCAMVLAFAGCDGIKDTLTEMREHPVVLPLDRMQCHYDGRDTVVQDSVVPVLRMVVYLDSAYYTSCALDRNTHSVKDKKRV